MNPREPCGAAAWQWLWGLLRAASCFNPVGLLYLAFVLLGVPQTYAESTRIMDNRILADTYTSVLTTHHLSSTVPSNATNTPIPLYGNGNVPGVSLNGIYCVDVVRRTAYIGADVISVFSIDNKELRTTTTLLENAEPSDWTDYKNFGVRFSATTGSSTGTTPKNISVFKRVSQLTLGGWATSCIFVNHYELYLAVVNGSTSQQVGSVNAGASRMHYVVIHRYLRTVLRTMSLPESAADKAVGARSASTNGSESASSLSRAAELAVSIGPSALLTRNLATGVTSVATPYWQGYLAVHNIASPFASTWTARVAGLDTLLAVTRINAGDGGGNSTPMLFAIGFVASSDADHSRPSHAQLADAWDIVGLRLDSIEGNNVPSHIVAEATMSTATATNATAMQPPEENSPEHSTASTQSAEGAAASLPQPNGVVQPAERLARCYRAAVQSLCPDCVPVAFTHARGGLVVAFVGYETAVTYLVPIPIHTACTTGTADDSASTSTSTSSTASSTREAGGAHVVLLHIAKMACNISGLEAADDASSNAFFSMSCQDILGAVVTKLRTISIREEWWFPEATEVVAPFDLSEIEVLHNGYSTTKPPGTTSEAVMRLTAVSRTHLVHLALRQLNGAVTVLTFAAFGLLTVTPSVIDAAGGTELRLTGYGIVPGMRCIFADTVRTLVIATVDNFTAARCTAPPLTGTSCASYPIRLEMTYEDLPWAIPSASPAGYALSPSYVLVTQLISPSIREAVLEETGDPYALSGTNATVLVTGTGFAPAAINSISLNNRRCRFWSPNAEGNESVTVPAVLINATTVLCRFVGIPMLPSPSYITVSNGGTLFTSKGAPFTSLGSAIAVKLEEQLDSNTMETFSTDLNGVLSTVPRVISSPLTVLPPIKAFLIDAEGHHVPVPAGTEGELLARMDIVSEGDRQLPPPVLLGSSPIARAALLDSSSQEGSLEALFDDSGAASFSRLPFPCVFVGVAKLCVTVVNVTSGMAMTEFKAGCVWLPVTEGRPHMLTFVQEPSATYYPDWPLLSRQPIIGLQDECLNVFRSISKITLSGDVTLQLYAEPQDAVVDAEVGHSASAVPYGPAWTAESLIQSFFYVTNLSMPVAAFNMRYYLVASAGLPVPQIWSGPMEMLACKNGRRSVMRSVAGTTATDGSDRDRNKNSDSDSDATEQRIHCDPCPAHGVCNGTRKVVVVDGYWRANATSVDFVSCRLGHGAAEACTNDGQCSPGYEGLLCGTCSKGYHAMGRVCRKCLPRVMQTAVLILVAVTALAGLTFIVVALALLPPLPLLIIASRMLLLSMQVLGLVGYVAVEWPPALEEFFNGLSATTDFVEILVSCSIQRSDPLVVLACTPLVYIPLVTLLAGLWLRLLHRNRINPTSMCAVVLSALLHRKQERFHVLRHTLARQLWEPRSGCDTRPSVDSPNDVRCLRFSSSPRNGQTVSSEWTISGGDAAPSNSLPLSLAAHLASLQAPLQVGRSTGADSSTTPVPMRSTSVDGSAEDMEAVVIGAFGRHTAGAVRDLMTQQPGVPQEWVVMAAMQAGDKTLFEAVRKMSVKVPTPAQVRRWTGCALDVAACLPAPGAVRHGTTSPSTKSRSGSPHGMLYLTGVAGEMAPQEGEEASTGESPAMLLRWRRVGMVAAYRAIAVQQFRASWIALLLSATSVTMICLYLNLLVHALLWQRCVSLDTRASPIDKANAIPFSGASVLCDSSKYAAKRNVGTIMIAVYGFAVPLALGAVAVLLKQHYGKDVAHAALPVICFGSTSLDMFVSLIDFLTKCVSAVIVVLAQMPLLQVGVLVGVFGVSLIVNSVWSVDVHFREMRIWAFSVALCRLITIARVILFVVSNILMLLAYLLISGTRLSDESRRGFTALVCLGVILAFLLFFVASMHQLISHIAHARDTRSLAERHESAEGLALQGLVQRYRDVNRTIELYLQACERGLLVAQKLDGLSRLPGVGEEGVSGGAAAGSGANTDGDKDDPLSFSSVAEMAEEDETEEEEEDGAGALHRSHIPTPTASSTSGNSRDDGGVHAPTTPYRRRSSRRSGTTPLSDDSRSDSRTSATTRPEELTHFPSYPELNFSDTTSRSTLAPSIVPGVATSRVPGVPARGRRRHKARMSAAFRSLGPNSRRQRGASTAVIVSRRESEGQGSSAQLDVLSPAHVATAADSEAEGEAMAVYPAGSALCEPADGNEYWVSPDAGAAGDVQTAEKAVNAATDAVNRTAATAALSLSARRNATPIRRTAGPSEVHADRDNRASPTRDGERHPTSPAAAATTTLPTAAVPLSGARGIPVAMPKAPPSTAAAAALVSGAAATTATAAPSSAWSDTFASVQLPTVCPTLRRSNSLVLSIRSLETENVTRVGAALTALMEESRAVAARAGSACDPTTAGVDGDPGGRGLSPSAAPPSSDQHHPTDAAALIDRYGDGGGLELDLASSFDPLAVPPLPLTRALTRAGAGQPTSLLTALQADMDSQLRLFDAIDVQDALPELDLGSLAGAAAELQQLGVPGVVLAGGGGGQSAPSSHLKSVSTPSPHSTSPVPAGGLSAASGGTDHGATVAGGGAGAPAAARHRAFSSGNGSGRGHGAPQASPAVDGTERGNATAPPLPVFRAVSQRPQRHHAAVVELPTRRRAERTRAGAQGAPPPTAPRQTAASGAATRGGATPSSVEVPEPKTAKRGRKP